MSEKRVTKRPSRVRLNGRALLLTEDISLIRRQLEGEDLAFDPDLALMNNISTDEMTPLWVCFYHDETLGRYIYVGMRDEAIRQDEVKQGGFSAVVSGKSKGCGSSREMAPYAEKWAGIELIVAASIEKIYRQNAQNIGLLTTTDFSLLDRLLQGEDVPLEAFTADLDPISKAVVEYGGLFNYNKARLGGETTPPPIESPRRPMTIVEQIIARHAFVKPGQIGVEAVKPGDTLFAMTDVRFSHEPITPMAESLMKEALGPDVKVTDPGSVFAFYDHLIFIDKVMPAKQREMGLLERVKELPARQADFATRQGIKLYHENPAGGAEAICHNAVVEDIAMPGQIVIGTDSHTCMAGVLGCFAFGVGSTDMANAWYTKDIRLSVPETVRFVLRGRKRPGVTAKDVMLYILATDFIQQGQGIGRVIEYSGEGLKDWSIDERATLTNMAVEAGSTTGIIEPDEITLEYLVRMRGLDPQVIRQGFLRSDPQASYYASFEIELDVIPPMVATPGDPRNGIPVSKLPGEVKIDIAYGGSCTGGKMADMDMYAEVLGQALDRGLAVAPGTQLFLQFGSQKIKEYARQRGYINIFQAVGAELIDPSCGACINAGPGASSSKDQVVVSAQNRNFPGRSGPGQLYLASPYVVAASAVAGRIVEPVDFLNRR
ncbi:MAG TPA: aconitase family protein [Blastocatellia bacterium]|nr:aconitase family protein [Blastocatellia bacterium]